MNTAVVAVASDTVTGPEIVTTGNAGSALMVAVAEFPVMTEPALDDARTKLKDSAVSSPRELAAIETETVLVVSPGRNVTEPIASLKSAGDCALPSVVA